jgi:DNA helicase-2/ATP-dependent DNA helicase PcrA
MEQNPYNSNPFRSNSHASLVPEFNSRLQPAGVSRPAPGSFKGGANGSNLSASGIFDKNKNFTQAPKEFGGNNLGTIDYGIGDTVSHIKFGVGLVTNINNAGRDYEVTVDFSTAGTKKMMASFAKLKKLS